MTTQGIQTILIAGGDGLVGKHLLSHIDTSKYRIIILSRKKKISSQDGVEYACWNTDNKTMDNIPSPHHIINLAGAGIADQRWTAKRKKDIINSRVNSAETIRMYLERHNVRPITYISASGVGYYGNRGEEHLNESSGPGSGFLPECCISWENTSKLAGNLCERNVIFRIGIVMSSKGGALPKMLMTKSVGLFNFFGRGNQFYPWIHITDLCRMFIEAIENPDIKGIYNAVAPQQITNKEMMKEIMEECRYKGILVSAPDFMLRIVLGEMADVILNSNKVIADKLIKSGFTFRYPKVGEAVKNVIELKI